MIHESVLSLVGKTPLVRLNRVGVGIGPILAVKLEEKNPGGSIKDRVALAMVEAAESSGELAHGKTIIEATSGNTGIGLAMVCAVKGLPLTLIMPDSASEERKMIMRAYGAGIILTPGRLGTDGAIEEAYQMAREHPEKYVLMDQFNNPASIEAHYRGTGQEIWDQTDGRVTQVVAALGTTGTAMGMAKRLHELSSGVQVIAVEPFSGHRIQGLKNMQESYPPGIFEKNALDRIIRIEDEAAFEMARRLAREEGIFAGMSGGAAVAGALRIAAELSEGLIVVILPDGGSRYLSTDLFVPPVERGATLFDIRTDREQPILCAAGTSGLFTIAPEPQHPGDPEGWRRIVLLDVLHAYLRSKGIDSKALVGVVDWDDQTLGMARERGLSRETFALSMLAELRGTAALLAVGEDVVFASAGEELDAMTEIAGKLVRTGYGYEKLRSVYFPVQRDEEYGSLGRMDLDKIDLGKTVDFDEYVKGDPRDFTLLKRASLSDLKRGEVVKTEWGNVRPSWYLQMAAVAARRLPDVRVVLGGSTHWFPHLENIRAILAAAANIRPAAWNSLGPVRLDQEEYADIRVSGAETGFRAVRAWLLSAEYARPLQASKANLAMWARNTARIQESASHLFLATHQSGEGGSEGAAAAEQAVFDLERDFAECMEHNLAVHRVWPLLFAFCKHINALIVADALSAEHAGQCLDALRRVDAVLRVVEWDNMPLPAAEWPEELEILVREREGERKARHFTRSDTLRMHIREMGYIVEDTRSGPRIFRL